MCVSAEASFAMAAVLAPVGIYCMKTARERDPALAPLAATPLFFSVQQACEGLVWVGLGRENVGLTHSAGLAFLFFALWFWPFWIPFSAAFLEPRRQVRRMLLVLAGVGVAGGALAYLPVLLAPDVLMAAVDQHSIRYDVADSAGLVLIPQLVWHLSYLAVVTLPLVLMARQRRGLVAFNVGIIVSAAISHAFFWYAFASVWCFFAAILAIMLAFMFRSLPTVNATLMTKPAATPAV